MDQDCRGCNASNAQLFYPTNSTSLKSSGIEGLLRYGRGAVDCDFYDDTVRFGGITMDNFTFGSCFGEIDMYYPERYCARRVSY
jgi:hypothetical protein